MRRRHLEMTAITAALAGVVLVLGRCGAARVESPTGPDSAVQSADAGTPDAAASPADGGVGPSSDAAGDADAAAGADARGTWVDSPRFIGRFDTSDPAGPRLAFSGTSVEARFTGTSLGVRMRDPSGAAASDQYMVVLDGAEQVVPMNSSREQYVVAQGLAPGEHHVVLSRNSEHFWSQAQFLGFELSPGGQLVPVEVPQRRLEFLGDSITCGYGVLAPAPCDFTRETESHYHTYAGLTARALGADQVTICQSGIGVVRNTVGNTANQMPDLYPRRLPLLAPGTWDFTAYVPHAVVINLATNDWGVGAPDETRFKAAYRDLLVFIRGNYPQAWLLLAVGPMLHEPAWSTTRGWLTQLAQERISAGDSRVEVVAFPTQDAAADGLGCGSHPSRATHQKMADQLTARLRALLGW